MDAAKVRKLLIIALLDSLCCGLVVPLLSPHILMHGGSHVITGFLVSGSFVCQMLSKDFTALFEIGKNFTIAFSLFISLFSYIILTATTSYYMVLICRFIYSLSQKTDVCCKKLIAEFIDSEYHGKLFHLVDIMTITGMVVGPILGGYIFHWTGNFAQISAITTIITMINIAILQRLDYDFDSQIQMPECKMRLMMENCQKQIGNLCRVDYKKHWDSVVVKIAYVTSFTVFFTKYSLMIKYNYDVGIVVVGYTIAYQNMLIFATNYIVPFLRQKLNVSSFTIFEHSLLITSVTLISLFYAPTYECYLILFVPMIFAHTFVDLLWDDSLELPSKPDLHQASHTITQILGVIVPAVFGYLAEHCQSHSFKIWAILPPTICAFIVNRYFFHIDEIKQD